MATCYDCIHCDACSDAGDSGFSCLKEDVSKCKHFIHSNDVVELPCKVGDTVWFIRENTHRIVETNVNKIVLKRGGIYLQLACNSLYETSCKSIGKSVFFNKEEAEKALAVRI